MKDLFRKGLLVGLGAAEFTRETLARAVEELQKKGEMSRTEARKVMDSFSRTAKKRQEEFGEAVGKGLSFFYGRMNIATDARIRELEKRLRSLERKAKAKK